jgi:ABC-type transport system substrate-binding protein
MKKFLMLAIALLVLVLIFSGCSSSSPTPTPKTTTPAASAPATTSAIPVPAATTKPPAATSSVPVTTTAIPLPASPVAASPSKYGGKLRDIDPNSPATPIGVPWETSGMSVLYMQLGLQCALKEYVDGSIGPNLASSFEVVSDPANPSVTLRFQKGVKFSDGTDFNAQAVKWNYDTMKQSNMYPSVTSYWKSVEIVDDYTVKVNMTIWLNKSLGSFAKSVTYLVSPTAFNKNGIDWLRWNMVGTGPFVQTNFQRDVSLTTLKNTNYWEKGKPYLDSFQYLFVADEMTRIALLKSGGGEILNLTNNGRIAQDLQNAGFKIVSQLNSVDVLVPDSANADSPWSSLKVRQAAEYAIDKESLARTFGFGFWAANYQMNTSNSIAYDKNLQGRVYDVAKAKQLLTDAGYPNGFKTALIASTAANANVVTAIQSYLGKVGIQTEMQFIAPTLYNGYTFTGSPWRNGIILNSYSQNPNPTQGFNGSFGLGLAFKSTGRPVGWMDTLNAAMATPKLEPAMIQKVENLAVDYVLTIPLYSTASLWAVVPNLQDIALGTRGDPNFCEPQDAWLSK